MIFRRRSRSGEDEEVVPETPSEQAQTGGDLRSRVGPWDAAERPSALDDPRTIDLGGLVITGRVGLEVRLETDPDSGAVASVLLVGEDGAVEIQAFAAGRSRGVWDDVRRDIISEAARLGGTATEIEGEYGAELRVVVPVQAPDGSAATQASRVVGIEGPRWLLRATYLGRPASAPTADDVLTGAVRDVVVVRGTVAMAPRDPLPLRLPADVELPDEPPS